VSSEAPPTADAATVAPPVAVPFDAAVWVISAADERESLAVLGKAHVRRQRQQRHVSGRQRLEVRVEQLRGHHPARIPYGNGDRIASIRRMRPQLALKTSQTAIAVTISNRI
jgi:hypothetical protein